MARSLRGPADVVRGARHLLAAGHREGEQPRDGRRQVVRCAVRRPKVWCRDCPAVVPLNRTKNVVLRDVKKYKRIYKFIDKYPKFLSKLRKDINSKDSLKKLVVYDDALI